MKIIFDKTVSEKLAKFGNADFVLDFDHELSEKNEAIDACAGGISRYRILAIDKGKLPEAFDAHMDSEFGPVYFKKWGKCSGVLKIYKLKWKAATTSLL